MSTETTAETGTRRLLVFAEKTFEITIPEDSRVTFGPWSPPSGNERYVGDRQLTGTLRVYRKGSKSSDDILAVFSGVRSFRDVSINYREQVAREEGAIIWKSDERGFERQEKVTYDEAWVEPKVPLLEGEEDEVEAA